MKNKTNAPEKPSGKSLIVLAVLSIVLLFLGIGTLVFALVYSGFFTGTKPQKANTEIYEKIPENATPVHKVIDDNLDNYEEPVDSPATKLLDVPYINQTSKYPTGCESVSAVMALKFAGYDITPEDFIDNYLPQSPTPYLDDSGKLFGYNPYKVFIGSPYSSDGWGCYYPVIGRCLSRIIDKDRHRIVRISNATMNNLTSYIDRDIPVIIWATQGMSKPERSQSWMLADGNKKFTWVSPNHCLLLVGYDDTGYYFNDPLSHKNCRYPAEIVQKRYNSMGRQALVIMNK